MDGKSRWAVNIKIERWFRSFKYEEVYLTEWHNIKEARAAIRSYIHNYNFERCHSAIGDVTPASVYYPAMFKRPNYMTVPAALKELEKIVMIRHLNGIYRLDHAITKT